MMRAIAEAARRAVAAALVCKVAESLATDSKDNQTKPMDLESYCWIGLLAAATEPVAWALRKLPLIGAH
jgi:hypothetical protein